MHAVLPDSRLQDAARRPTALELSAAGLLAGSVILHVVALIPPYYGGSGQGSLWSEPDQAAQYLLLAAGWALALALVMSGPARARLGAAVAVGVAATEFGFRLSDLGEVFRYGQGMAAAGLWLMTAAWVVGAGGAVVAVVAVWARGRKSQPPVPSDADSSNRPAATEAPRSGPAGSPGSPGPPPAGPGSPAVPPEAPEPSTTPLVVPTSLTGPVVAPPSGSLGAAPTVLIALLALATAGAFLPAWDHYAGVATTTGRAVSFNLGDAFSGPWQVVIGTVFVALALAAVPVLATRMGRRPAGAALVAGALIVLATQFTAAVVQTDHTVPPSIAGLSGAQANQLGLQLHMTLTGWFTCDLLAAFSLFVAAMVLGHVGEVRNGANSAEVWPPGVPYAPSTLGPPPS